MNVDLVSLTNCLFLVRIQANILGIEKQMEIAILSTDYGDDDQAEGLTFGIHVLSHDALLPEERIPVNTFVELLESGKMRRARNKTEVALLKRVIKDILATTTERGALPSDEEIDGYGPHYLI